jgi:hypothetical protein
MENSVVLMEINTKVTGLKIKWKVRAKQFRPMETYMKENGKLIRDQAMENSFGKTVIFLKANGLTI